MHKKTIEEYLEVIYLFEKKKGRAGTKDVATHMGINPASVTEMFCKLMEGGYVEYTPYKGVKLTRKGKRIARKLTEKHKTIAEFLKAIGVDEINAELEACKIEHIMNDNTLQILQQFYEYLDSDEGRPILERYRKKYNIK